jgi:hypothetical protein
MLPPATGRWFEIMSLNFVVKGNINSTNTQGKKYTKDQKKLYIPETSKCNPLLFQ